MVDHSGVSDEMNRLGVLNRELANYSRLAVRSSQVLLLNGSSKPTNSKCFTQSPDALSDFSLVHPRVAEYYPWP